VRVATALGVVLALGPLDPGDADRRAATELVPELGAFHSGTDLNGDGLADVLVKNDAGTIEVWRVDRLGSAPYAIEMAVPPSRAEGGEGGGLLVLAGDVPVPAGDPIAPRFDDVATFAGGRYTDTSDAARAWHEARAPAPSNAPVLTPPPDEARLRAALERAWHAVLAGQSVETVLRALGREPVPLQLRAAFDRHTRTIADKAPRR
jgi:hypothetical protein